MPWTPVNGPRQDRSHLESQTPPSEKTVRPSKKRKRCQQEDDGPPPPPKTVKNKKTPSKQPKTRKASKTIINIKSNASSLPQRAVLLETTRNKSIATRHNAYPTPVSDEFHDDTTQKENILPKFLPLESPTDITSKGYSSDLLSDDLWKNQQRMPEYPWLYRNHDFRLELLTTNSTEVTELELLRQMLETNDQEQTRTESDNLINDKELEQLMDEMIRMESVESEDADSATLHQESSQTVPKIMSRMTDDPSDLDNFDLDNDELSMLYEAASPSHLVSDMRAKSKTKQIDSDNRNQMLDVTPIQHKTPSKTETAPVTMHQRTRRSKASPSKPSQPKIKTLEDSGFVTNGSTKLKTSREIVKCNSFTRKSSHTDTDPMDLDDTDFQDMLDLVEALPHSPTENTNYPHNPKTSIITTSIIPTVNPTSSPPSLPATEPTTPTQQPQQHPNSQHRFHRPSYPTPLSTPSPIPGLSASQLIQTHFRLGSAINATALFQRQHPSPSSFHHTQPAPGIPPILPATLTIELFARVLCCTRPNTSTQSMHFSFVDLFSTADKPGIILEGYWEGWRESQHWIDDARVFLDDGLHGEQKRRGRKCRVVGELVRMQQGEDRKWIMLVRRVCSVGWGDVEFAGEVVGE